MITLPLQLAKNIVIQAQRFSGSSKGQSALEIIEHLGYVQIDTLAVVSRAHHHTLWSRVTNYQEKDLNILLEKDKTIFEYWSHAASYLPMSDFRYSLIRKRQYQEGKSHWFTQDKKIKKYVYDRIKAEGPLQSKDFEYKRNGPGNWFEWKPAKKALEQLFMEGELMVSKRQGFQKVYDLTEKVLPKKVNTKLPTEKEYAEFLVRKTIQSHGLADSKEIHYLRPALKDAVGLALLRLVKSGELLEVKIEGLGNTKFYTTNEYINSANNNFKEAQLQVLSPFDNAIIQRQRIKRLFDYDYKIECYVPEPKREFGYFCLPVLYKNQFVARLDPKADRASKTFYVKSMHFEESFKRSEKFNIALADKLKTFAHFNGCTHIDFLDVDKKWKEEIKQFID